jgi:protein TonB
MFILIFILLFRFMPLDTFNSKFRFFPLIGFMLFLVACGDGSTSNSSNPNQEEILTNAEEMPEFKGGSQKLIEYISKNVRYPANARDMEMEGNVQVSFVVDKDGSIKDAEIVKGVYSEINDEAIRVVESMPKWKPGKNKGKKVAVQLILPIRFELPKEEDKK